MDDDLDLVVGTPNNSWASITSRPLFISVEESTVIFGPIDHVGCARAWSTVTPSSSARVRPRNGPPEAVSTTRATSPADRCRRPQTLVHGAVFAVDRNKFGPGVDRSGCTIGPAAIRLSLLASARRLPAVKGGDRDR